MISTSWIKDLFDLCNVLNPESVNTPRGLTTPEELEQYELWDAKMRQFGFNNLNEIIDCLKNTNVKIFFILSVESVFAAGNK